MADRLVDERIRKPRRTKGTPLYIQRNYFAGAFIAFGALSWFIFECTATAQEIKKLQKKGEKFVVPAALQSKADHIRASFENPTVGLLLSKARDRAA